MASSCEPDVRTAESVSVPLAPVAMLSEHLHAHTVLRRAAPLKRWQNAAGGAPQVQAVQDKAAGVAFADPLPPFATSQGGCITTVAAVLLCGLHSWTGSCNMRTRVVTAAGEPHPKGSSMAFCTHVCGVASPGQTHSAVGRAAQANVSSPSYTRPVKRHRSSEQPRHPVFSHRRKRRLPSSASTEHCGVRAIMHTLEVRCSCVAAHS